MRYSKHRKTVSPKAKATKKSASKAAKKKPSSVYSLTIGPRLIPDLSDPEDSQMFAASIDLANYYRLGTAR